MSEDRKKITKKDITTKKTSPDGKVEANDSKFSRKAVIVNEQVKRKGKSKDE